MDLTLIIVFGILLGCLITLSWFAGSDAPFVPTKMDGIRKILKLAGVKKGKKFYELGSGDGRVVIEAAKLGAESFGIEQSWIRVLWSRYLAKKQNLPNTKFIHGNIFSFLSFPRRSSTPRSLRLEERESINNTDVVYIYLLSKGVEKLEPLLKKSLKKNANVITQTYHFKNWKPEKMAGDFWIYKV